ncbi:MAG: hypothetical protein LBR31_03180 [Desulfovibrio sp.]|jgi:hypothetical protein|nr:hypothetical protein [Desulfovibrio sp.]
MTTGMIASFIDGRIRLRADSLKSPKNMESLLAFLQGRKGLLDVRPNLRTGSVLVRYDVNAVSREELLGAVNLLQTLFPADKTLRRSGKRRENLCLGLLYGLVAGSAFVNRRLHVCAAVLFTLSAFRHAAARKP